MLVLCILTAGVMASCHDKQLMDKRLTEFMGMDSLKTQIYKWSAELEMELDGVGARIANPHEQEATLPDSAIALIETFLRISEEKEDYRDLCVTLKARYNYYRNRNNFMETYQSACQCVDAAKLSRDSTLLSDAICLLGRLLFINGCYYESLDYFLQMTEMNLPTDNLANLYYTMAQVYSVIALDDNSLVSRYYVLAEMETQKPDFSLTRLKGVILSGRAYLFIPFSESELFDFNELRPSQADSLHKAIAMMEESLNYTQGCMQYAALSLFHALLAEMPKSRQCLRKALELTSDNDEWLGDVNYVRAIVDYREKNFNEAIDMATSVMETSIARHDLTNVQKCMRVLYYIYRKTGESDKSLYFLEQATLLSDSLLKKAKQEQTIVNQIKYETKVKEEQRRTEKEKKYNHIIHIRIIGVTVMGLLLLVGLLVRNYLLKQKTYLSLYSQIKEQDRLADKLKQLTNNYRIDGNPLTDELNPYDCQPGNDALPDNSVSSLTTNKKSIHELHYQLLVSRLRNYVLKDRNFAKHDIDRDDLISALSTNRTTLSEAVKAVTNKTLMEYINALRLEEAKQLIDRHAELTIEAIAEKCGFNLRTFHRLFSECYHISPAKYRKMIRVKKPELTQ